MGHRRGNFDLGAVAGNLLALARVCWHWQKFCWQFAGNSLPAKAQLGVFFAGNVATSASKIAPPGIEGRNDLEAGPARLIITRVKLGENAWFFFA
jgi:hypothetical protein